MGIATYKELVKAGRPVRLIYLDDDGLYPAIKVNVIFYVEVAIFRKNTRVLILLINLQ